MLAVAVRLQNGDWEVARMSFEGCLCQEEQLDEI